MILANHEVPIAYSMMVLASRPSPSAFQPLQDFVCYWTAFNNIYVTVAGKKGRRVSLKHSEDGTLQTRRVANVRIPKVKSMGRED